MRYLIIPVVCAVLLWTGQSLAQGTYNSEDSGVDLNASTQDLENRLTKLSRDISELEASQDYLKTEDPVFEDSSGMIESTGFNRAPQAVRESKLIGPGATRDVNRKLDEAYRLRKAIEKELDRRYSEGKDR